MDVYCECCVLSGRGLCDELVTRPEESYRLCCVVVCDLKNLMNEEAMTRVWSQRHRGGKKVNYQIPGFKTYFSETVYGGVDWIQLGQIMGRSLSLTDRLKHSSCFLYHYVVAFKNSAVRQELRCCFLHDVSTRGNYCTIHN